MKKTMKKRGMSMAKWENSAADKKHDSVRKFAAGGGIDDKPPPPSMVRPRVRPSLDQLHADMPETNAFGGAAGTSRMADGYRAGGAGDDPRAAAYRAQLDRSRDVYRNSAADQLMRQGQMKAYGGPAGYIKALQQAQGRTDENGARVGSADFQAEAAQKGFSALQKMPEYKKWGLDQNHDWSQQGVTTPAPAANNVAAMSPQSAAMKNAGIAPAKSDPRRMGQQMKPQMKAGGVVKKMASGGAVRGNGCASKGLTKGKMR